MGGSFHSISLFNASYELRATAELKSLDSSIVQPFDATNCRTPALSCRPTASSFRVLSPPTLPFISSTTRILLALTQSIRPIIDNIIHYGSRNKTLRRPLNLPHCHAR